MAVTSRFHDVIMLRRRGMYDNHVGTCVWRNESVASVEKYGDLERWCTYCCFRHGLALEYTVQIFDVVMLRQFGIQGHIQGARCLVDEDHVVRLCICAVMCRVWCIYSIKPAGGSCHGAISVRCDVTHPPFLQPEGNIDGALELMWLWRLDFMTS